jgi:hypothetical protein
LRTKWRLTFQAFTTPAQLGAAERSGCPRRGKGAQRPQRERSC